jgi:hypothetical protein
LTSAASALTALAQDAQSQLQRAQQQPYPSTSTAHASRRYSSHLRPAAGPSPSALAIPAFSPPSNGATSLSPATAFSAAAGSASSSVANGALTPSTEATSEGSKGGSAKDVEAEEEEDQLDGDGDVDTAAQDVEAVRRTEGEQLKALLTLDAADLRELRAFVGL